MGDDLPECFPARIRPFVDVFPRALNNDLPPVHSLQLCFKPMPDADNNTEEIRRSVAQWLLEENHRTAVADFQRPYTWSESHVTAFTESLLDSLFQPETGAPDIGVVVIEETSDTDFIVDGQQRLLTFALLIVEWYGEMILNAKRLGVKQPSRLKHLLQTNNLQSTIHARRIRRIIRNVCQRRSDASAASKGERLTLLRSVTFSIVAFERKRGETSNPAVRNFFEPLNTTAKPLNGGQILKAYHMGRIYETGASETWNLQSRYETWFRGHKEDRKLGLNAFTPFCFNLGDEISVESFIDSHGQDAFYKLGCGFVQAIQAMLLGQDEWWWEIASQGSERQAPFERLEGGPRADKDEDGVREWRATDPLAFSEAEGFFRMVGRFARLYDAYCLELLGLFDRWPEKIRNRVTDRGLAEDDPDRRPARLVCRAARLMAAFGRCVIQWSEKGRRLREEKSLGKLCDIENDRRIQIKPWVSDAKAWLDLPELPRDFSNTFGSIPTAVYAAALLWSDKFPYREADDDIVRLLMVQLLFARFGAKWNSVWKAFSMREAVAAAHFSTNSQGALWRFLKTARYMGSDWPRDLEATIVKMQKEFFSATSEEVPVSEGARALDELRTVLSQYLSF